VEVVTPLRVVRTGRGMRQADVATLAGVSRPHLSELEAGHYRPRRATAERLAAALAWPLAELFPIYDDGRADDAAAVTTTGGRARDEQP
jgi:transcriptional regulator with XRE-family HTH domain